VVALEATWTRAEGDWWCCSQQPKRRRPTPHATGEYPYPAGALPIPALPGWTSFQP